MPDSNGPDTIDKEFGKLVFEWEIHPARQNRKKLILLIIISLLFFMFLLEITKSLLLTYMIFLIYLFTLKSFIFKTYYRLFENGLCVVQLGFSDCRKYNAFVRVFGSHDSILLSTMREYSFVAKTRGIELVFQDPCLKEKVKAFLEDRLERSE